MAKKTDDFFFNNFVESITIANEAAAMLKDVLTNFNTEKLPEQLEELHAIEHRADKKKHEMVSELVRAFITPLERDDIMNLSHNIDNVTDCIEDILIRIYINNVRSLRPDVLEFASILIKACAATKALLEEFHNFKKSKTLHELIIEINHCEDEGDKLYMQTMRDLHTTSTDPMEVIAWREVYGFFEKCIDACEDVADVVQSTIIGNT